MSDTGEGKQRGMSRSKQLSREKMSRIKTALADKSVSQVAKALGVSRNTVYRWKARVDVARKSRRPKTNTASLLPVQRDVIYELIRLSLWPKRELVPVVSRVFPVFSCVGEGGQRRLWKEVLGVGAVLPATLAPEEPFYRSSFRIGAIYVAGGTLTPPVCVLVAWENPSGVVVHRVVEGRKDDFTDFMLDLCHQWPFQIAEITFVSTEKGVFPGRLSGWGNDNVSSVRNEEFVCRSIRQPISGADMPQQAGPQTQPPKLNFEDSLNSPRIIELPQRHGPLDLNGVKRVVRSWAASHNTRLRGKRTKWLTMSHKVLTPKEYLIRAWEAASMNGAVRDVDPADVRRDIDLLLKNPLVMHNWRQSARRALTRGSIPGEKK